MRLRQQSSCRDCIYSVIMSVYQLTMLTGSCKAGQYETQLYGKILQNYEVLERPVADERETMPVKLGLTLQQIIDIDERNQIMQTNIWLTLNWRDYRLVWDPAEYGNVSEIRLSADKIWKPDVLLYNSVDDKFNTIFPVNVVVSHDGSLEWIPPAIVKSTCKINLTWVPFDDQICTLKYGSWTHSGNFIDLRVGNITTNTYIESGEWQLLGVTATRNEYHYECCPEPYYDVTFSVWIRRRTLYYGMTLVIPCFLISVMVLLDFILPPESGEKLTLCISIFMSLYVFLQMVGADLPPTADSIPLIGAYSTVVTVIVSMSQVATVMVLNLHYRSPMTHQMSPLMRWLFLNWLPWLLMMERPGFRTTRRGLVARRSSGPSSQTLLRKSQNAMVSSDGPDNRRSPNRIAEAYLAAIQSLAEKLPVCTCAGDSTEIAAILERILKTSYSICQEVSVIATNVTEEEDERNLVDEWKFAARVLDRLCLIVFSTVLLACTMAILFSAPHISA